MTEPSPAKEQAVWDVLVRLLHWSVVLALALAWITSEAGRPVHEPVGYALLGAVVLRLLWGLVGSRYARWSQFLRGPRATARYTTALLQGRAPRYVGHNPLGAWMIAALMLALLATAASGWLMTTDALFGAEWIEELHEALAIGLALLAALHVAGVVLSSWLHHENLVLAMWTGRKRRARGTDVA